MINSKAKYEASCSGSSYGTGLSISYINLNTGLKHSAGINELGGTPYSACNFSPTRAGHPHHVKFKSLSGQPYPPLVKKWDDSFDSHVGIIHRDIMGIRILGNEWTNNMELRRDLPI